jgi:hypothetical protein
MKKAVGAACLVALLFAGGARAAGLAELDKNTEASIMALNKLGELLAGIKDKASADKAKPQLKEMGETLKKLKAESDKLGKPTPEQQKELAAKHGKAARSALDKLTRQITRLSREEHGRAALQDVQLSKAKKN